jgi:hypothetical protein
MKLTYSKDEQSFAHCFGVKSADIVVQRVKAHKLDKYKALDKFVGYLLNNGKAPKTVLVYVTAIKGLFRYEGIKLDNYDLHAKVELPPKVEVSMDRIPTRDEMRSMILNSKKTSSHYWLSWGKTVQSGSRAPPNVIPGSSRRMGQQRDCYESTGILSSTSWS